MPNFSHFILALNIFLSSLTGLIFGKYHLRSVDLATKSIGKASYGTARERFFNDGRLYGWDSQHSEYKGTINEIRDNCFDNGVDSDSHCLKFTQLYTPDYTGRYHSEVVLNNATQHGQTTYYGFAFKLIYNWEFDESYGYGDKVINNRIAIAQFITNFRDIDCGKSKKIAVPTTMIWLQNDKLYIRLRSGVVCFEDAGSVHEFKIGTVVPGQWHTVVFGVNWHKKERGWFKVWFDKKLRVDEENIKTFMDIDDRLFQFRVGIYPNWWTWDHSGHPFIQPGHQKHKEIYIDHIGFGPEFADADPWSEIKSEKSIETRLNYFRAFIRRMKQDSASYIVDKELDIIDNLKTQLRTIAPNAHALSSQKLRKNEMKKQKRSQRESIEANLEKSQEDLEKLPEVTTTDDNRELDKNEPESPANADSSEEEAEEGAQELGGQAEEVVAGQEAEQQVAGQEAEQEQVEEEAEEEAEEEQAEKQTEEGVKEEAEEIQQQEQEQENTDQEEGNKNGQKSGGDENLYGLEANANSAGSADTFEPFDEKKAFQKSSGFVPDVSPSDSASASSQQNKLIQEEAHKASESPESANSFQFPKINPNYIFLAISSVLICYVFRNNFRDDRIPFDINSARRAVVNELSSRLTPHDDDKEI